MALKFGSKSGLGYTRDPFPTHNGVQSGPLNSGSPAKQTSNFATGSDAVDDEVAVELRKQADAKFARAISKKEDKVPDKKESKPSGKRSYKEAYAKRDMSTYGDMGEAEYIKEAKRQTVSKKAGKGWDVGGGSKKEDVIVKKDKTPPSTKVNQKPEIKGSFKDNYQEGSEKTKNLERKLRKKDQQTEDAYVESELAEAHEGKYGKGLFGGYLRRQGAKGKHKRKGRQEDRTREKYNKSKAYDAMTPEQRASADATRKADRSKNRKLIEAEFKDAANIIGGPGHRGGSGDALRAQVSKDEQLTQSKADQKIKTDRVNLATTQANEDRALVNEGRRLTNKQRQISIDASAKAKDGGAKVPAAEGTFAVNDDGTANYEETYADKVTKKYGA